MELSDMRCQHSFGISFVLVARSLLVQRRGLEEELGEMVRGTA